MLSPSTHPSSDPSALSEAFQTFYTVLEEDLRGGASGSLIGRRKEEQWLNHHSHDDPNTPGLSISKSSIENERGYQDDKDSESRVREILEQVECVICCTFYDRFVVSSNTSLSLAFSYLVLVTQRFPPTFR